MLSFQVAQQQTTQASSAKAGMIPATSKWLRAETLCIMQTQSSSRSPGACFRESKDQASPECRAALQRPRTAWLPPTSCRAGPTRNHRQQRHNPCYCEGVGVAKKTPSNQPHALDQHAFKQITLDYSKVTLAHLSHSHAASRSSRGRGACSSARGAAGEAAAAAGITGATAWRHLWASAAAAGAAAAVASATAAAATAASTGATTFSNGADGVDGAAAAAATAARASASAAAAAAAAYSVFTAASVARSASAATPQPRGAALLHRVHPILATPAALPARQSAVQQPQVLHVTGTRHTQYGCTGGVHPGGWAL